MNEDIKPQPLYELTEKYPIRFKSHQRFEDVRMAYTMFYLDHKGNKEMINNFLEEMKKSFYLVDCSTLTEPSTFFVIKYEF